MIEVFKLDKISMTNEEIANVFATNNVRKRQEAIDCLINGHFGDISQFGKDIQILNESKNLYSSIMHSPKSYARWIINLTADMIAASKTYGVSVKYNINSSNGYTEFKFDVFQNRNRECDKEISLLISKNGIVADFDSDYASISRNRNNPESWNARFPEDMIDYLPLAKNTKKYVKSKTNR